jgi:hypothetical protein
VSHLTVFLRLHSWSPLSIEYLTVLSLIVVGFSVELVFLI